MTEETKEKPKPVETENTVDEQKQDKPWLFKPGQSGNPEGRPKGARVKFGEAFVKEYMEHWQKHGKGVLDKLAKKKPHEYARIACAILPKIVELDDESKDILREAVTSNLPFEAIRRRVEEKRQEQTAAETKH